MDCNGKGPVWGLLNALKQSRIEDRGQQQAFGQLVKDPSLRAQWVCQPSKPHPMCCSLLPTALQWQKCQCQRAQSGVRRATLRVTIVAKCDCSAAGGCWAVLHIQRRKMLQRHTWHCNQSCNGIIGYTKQMCSWRLRIPSTLCCFQQPPDNHVNRPTDTKVPCQAGAQLLSGSKTCSRLAYACCNMLCKLRAFAAQACFAKSGHGLPHAFQQGMVVLRQHHF